MKQKLKPWEIFVGLLFGLLGVWWMIPSEKLPETLSAAGLTGKVWSQDEANLAAKITRHNLRDIQSLVESADSRGDSGAASQAMVFLLPIMRAWNDQSQEILRSGYRNCQLAAAHLGDGAFTVNEGGHFDPDRFEGALKACNSAIR